MKEPFYNIIPDDKRSIRNIPIPSREQKESINQKLTEAENAYIAEVTEEHEAEPIPVHKKKITPSMDGIKKPGKKRKYVPEVAEQEDVEPLKAPEVPKESAYEVEPAFVDKEFYEEEEKFVEPAATESFESWKKDTKKGYVFWILCGGALALVFIAISYLFTGATITLFPKKYDIEANTTKIYLSDIAHKKVEVKVSDEMTVPVDGTVQVERKATGTVVLYNAFNSSEQKLVANTRLETSTGKVFRLTKAVTIPGQKTVSGKAVPGSVEVAIEADKAGSEYNVSFQDFTLPAYKGTPRYDKIYARSKTAVDNGYLGAVPNLGTKDVASTTQTLKEALLQKALEETEDENPDSKIYALLNDSYVADYGTIEQVVSKDGKKVTFKGTLTLTSIFMSSEDLSKSILKAENMIKTGSSTPITYSGDTSMLRIAFPKDIASSDLADTSKVYFTVSGTSSIYTMVSEETVAQAVSNLKKDRAIPVLQELTDSPNVTVSIWPWWKSTIPSKDRIRLKIK